MSIAPTHPRTSPLLRTTLKMMAAGALLGALFGLAPLGLPHAEAAEMSHLRIGANAYGGTQRVEVGLNKSMIVDLPADVGEVIVSQPLVAGAILRSKQRVIIQGNAAGDTNIFFLDRAGQSIAVLDLTVAPQRSDVAAVLAATLQRVLPGSAIRVDAVEDGSAAGTVTSRVVLSGTAQSGDDIEKAIAIASQFAGGSGNVASVVTTSTPQQVMLKVTIAEVNREVAKQLGINLSISANGLGATLLNNRANDVSSALGVVNPGQLGVSFDAGFASVDATVRALQSNRALRLLAEPVLTAMTGEEADFLVGGEVPIRETDQSGNVSTTFKEYGVKLNFTPTVRSNGRIGLEVETEASELLTSSGQLSKRRASTSVELPAGQTLAIGGLLQDSSRHQISRMPGFGDIPILGALFRSRDFVQSQTELVILVTPILAFPTAETPTLPTDNLVMANDAEAIFLGRMEAIYGVGPDGMRGSYSGSVGFVLD